MKWMLENLKKHDLNPAYRFESCPDYLCCSLEKGMSRESLLQLTSTTQRTSHPQHSQVAELVDAKNCNVVGRTTH